MRFRRPVDVAAGGLGPAAIGALYLAAVTAALVQYDLRELRLPDALVLPGAAFVAVGVVWSSLGGGGGGGWAVAVAAVLCGLGALAGFAVLASGGGLGMGDVKLAAVLAAALAAAVAERGPPAVDAGTAGSVVAAGIAVVAWAAVSLVAGAVAAGVSLRWRGPGRSGRGASGELPFGPVLLAVFWVVVLVG